jgi:hypothetical protein
MAFSARLGTADSRLGNLVLGLGSTIGVGWTVGVQVWVEWTGHVPAPVHALTTAISTAVVYGSSSCLARSTALSAAVVFGASSRLARTTAVSVQVIYDPAAGPPTGDFRADVAVSVSWHLGLQSVEWKSEPSVTVQWNAGLPASFWRSNSTVAVEWRGLQSHRETFACDSKVSVSFVSSRDQQAEWTVGAKVSVEWICRIPAEPTECLSGDGAYPDWEENYVF